MTRVYHFILDHRIGGPHIYVDTLRNSMVDKVDSVIVTTGHGPMTDIALLCLRHYWPPLYALELLINSILILGLVYTGRIKRHDSIFHIHGGATLAPIIAARILGIPVVWTIHEIVSCYQRLVQLGLRLLRRVPHYLVVVAESSRNAYQGFGDAILIPGAVDNTYWNHDQVSATSALEAWKIPPQQNRRPPLRILSVGNLNPLKGADVLLHALQGLEGPWVLNIVGMPLTNQQLYAQELYESATKLALQDSRRLVSFLGWQNREQVRELLAGCDVFVLPSRSEACPLALLEAMAMGCFCVAADVGDVYAILADYEDSAVFSSGSSDELLAHLKVRQIITSEPRTIKKASSLGVYSMDALAVSYNRLYSQITSCISV